MSAAACSCRTSSGRMPSLMQDASASSIGPPIRKKRMSVPSFLSERARISEPVISAMSPPPLDHAIGAQLLDFGHAQAQPFTKDFVGVLTEERCRHQRQGLAAVAYWPGRHLKRSATRMLHELHDAAAL